MIEYRMKTEVSKAGPIITEDILDQAIAAACEGSCSARPCCVLGFARRIAGLPEQNKGPQAGEIVDTPRARTIARLMTYPYPEILRVMRAVQPDGSIDLSGADLREIELPNMDLAGANLSGADLAGAYLPGANLAGANLARANLLCANLAWADIAGADLAGANLDRADLSGANLSCVRNLDKAINLDKAVGLK